MVVGSVSLFIVRYFGEGIGSMVWRVGFYGCMVRVYIGRDRKVLIRVYYLFVFKFFYVVSGLFFVEIEIGEDRFLKVWVCVYREGMSVFYYGVLSVFRGVEFGW